MDPLLLDAWNRAVVASAADPEIAARELLSIGAAYHQPHRHYHTLEHVRQMLAQARPEVSPTLVFACFFHDVVYRTWLPRNEERSAAVARRALRRMRGEAGLGAEVARFILATRDHTTAPSEPGLDDFLDRDLSILGSAPAIYQHYAAAVAREYAWLPPARYRAGRRQFLLKLLAAERVFRTPPFFAAFESTARANLAAEAEWLDDAPNAKISDSRAP